MINIPSECNFSTSNVRNDTMGAIDMISDYYNRNDPRTSDMFLISNPGTVLAILLFYNYFCLSLGPRYMKNKPAYSLRTTLIIYNFIQVLLSIYIVYEALMAGWLFEYSYTCQPVDYSHSPSGLRMARVSHFYFECKLIELLDTVFFVLRKKQRQVSFLHLYHHTTMPLLTWYGVRYFPGGHGTFSGMINSFIHVIMYGYYMLAACGPKVQKYLWWKKHLTILQMLQFAIIGLHSARTLFADCNFPKTLLLLIMSESTIFVYMFGSFYIKNHVLNKGSKVDPDNATPESRTSVKSD